MIFLSLPATGETDGGPDQHPPCPPGTNAWSLPQALAFTTHQLAVLERAHAILRHLAELVHQAQADRADWPALQTEWRRSVDQWVSLAATEYHREKLFTGAALAVDLQAEGNQLILGGIQLKAPTYAKALAAGMHQSLRAAHSGDVVALAQRRLALDEAIARANLDRLGFCARQLAALHPNAVSAAPESAAPILCPFPPRRHRAALADAASQPCQVMEAALG